MMRTWAMGWVLALGGWLGVAAGGVTVAGGADWKLATADEAPPEEVEASIRQELQEKALQIKEGEDLVFSFWLVNELPLSSEPGSPTDPFSSMEATTLLGVVQAHEQRRDYRDDEIYEDVYTIRYGLRPQDGAHLGASDYNYFGVLVPAEKDTEPGAITRHDDLVEASSEDTFSQHPMILSLRPASSAEGELPSLTEPATDHHAVRVALPAKIDGQESTTEVVFDLVFEGTGHL